MLVLAISVFRWIVVGHPAVTSLKIASQKSCGVEQTHVQEGFFFLKSISEMETLDKTRKLNGLCSCSNVNLIKYLVIMFHVSEHWEFFCVVSFSFFFSPMELDSSLVLIRQRILPVNNRWYLEQRIYILADDVCGVTVIFLMSKCESWSGYYVKCLFRWEKNWLLLLFVNKVGGVSFQD